MTTEATTPVGQDLQAKGIAFEEFRHAGPVRSLEQAAEERNQRPEQVVRSILFRLAQDEYLMVAVAGPNQIDWRALRQAAGQSRMTMAKPEEVLQVTGYQIGAVAPFGLPIPIRIMLDESILQEEIVSMGSGVRGTAVILSTSELQRALGDVEVVNVLSH
ncbi:MAG: YbaK/EbsC family protein [Chloroflexota bacterium]